MPTLAPVPLPEKGIIFVNEFNISLMIATKMESKYVLFCLFLFFSPTLNVFFAPGQMMCSQQWHWQFDLLIVDVMLHLLFLVWWNTSVVVFVSYLCVLVLQVNWLLKGELNTASHKSHFYKSSSCVHVCSLYQFTQLTIYNVLQSGFAVAYLKI